MQIAWRRQGGLCILWSSWQKKLAVMEKTTGCLFSGWHTVK